VSVKFQVSGSNSFLDMRGSQMHSEGAAPITRPLAQNVTSETSISPYLSTCDISTNYLY